MRAERDVTRQTGAETQVGFLDVRPGRKRIHFPARDAGNCNGKLNCTLFVRCLVDILLLFRLTPTLLGLGVIAIDPGGRY